MPRSAISVLMAFVTVGGILFAAGYGDYPELHTVLDTAMALLTGVLALLLWDVGARTDATFPKWLAISFAVTAILELLHVLIVLEWSGPLAWIPQATGFLRPATWPPSVHVLPIGIIAAIWLAMRGRSGVTEYAVGMTALAVGLIEMFQWLPTYVPPGPLGITRPALVLAPLLWAVVGWRCWRLIGADRMFPALALMALVLVLGNTAMLYSRAPHDTPAMVAHLGKVGSRLILLLSLMRMATFDMLERIRAERELARMNEGLERRVVERTTQLQATNQTLANEIGIRSRAEQKAQAQLGRLNLLHQITRAIGERQDLHSIFQVVVRSLENELPVDFCCLCLHDAVARTLTVAGVGIKSGALAFDLAMPERSRIDIDANGLSRCVSGRLVYEPDIAQSQFPFPQRLALGGLRSVVMAPLQAESHVFGVLLAARVVASGFSSGECEFLRQLSEHVALAANQAQLYGALRQAYDDLRQTQQAVMQQERLRALGQMASGTAHDINNALSPVALYTQSLLETEPGLSLRARDYLETIQRAVEDVANTVARMREFYRPREPQLIVAPANLNQLVEQVVGLTRARWSNMAQQRGTVIEVQTELADDLPAISGIESEIREAFTNLIFNAIDAMPDGGRLILRTDVAESINGSGRGQIRVEVTDNGVGMDEEARRRCMEPFFTTKGERGTGLGLAMVYGVVQRHGAEIDISSAPGQGTTVSLTFPTHDASAAAPVRSGSRRTLSRLRLLLVDDDPLLLKALRNTLETDGHLVAIADDGQTGIDAFRAAQQRGEAFSVVITDLGMPYVDGRRVAAAVKAASPTTPVILLTGWGQRLMSDDDIPQHVDLILGKPPRLHELREALAQCCRAEVAAVGLAE